MISLPNFAEFVESVNSDQELTEDNYCDKQPVTMEFTFEEHDLLNDIIRHAIDAYDFVMFSDISVKELPFDNDIRQRYEMLESIKNRSFALWADRYGKNNY